jgi:hypothetical protein
MLNFHSDISRIYSYICGMSFEGFFNLLVVVVLGFEFGESCLLGQCSTTFLCVLVIFRDRSCGLFSWTGFKP